MKKNVCRMVALVVVALMLLFGSRCARNVPWVKEKAAQAAVQLGFEIIGYEGYTWYPVYGGTVWYTLRRQPDNGIIYHAGFTKWGEEVHIYNLEAVDAIKPVTRTID